MTSIAYRQAIEVVSTRHTPSLVVDQIIDCTQADFCGQGALYDVILGNVGNGPLADIRSVLKPGGTLLCNSSTGFAFLA